MKMLTAAFLAFPASWAALPQTPPARLTVSAAPAENIIGCAWIEQDGDGPAWGAAKQVRGVREAADLDQIGEGRFVVIDAKLRGARLAGHRTAELCFEGGDLTKTDWRGVKTEKVGFAGSDLSGAVMRGAALRRTQFRDSRLVQVDAAEADLSESRIEGGSLDGLVLRNAKMRGFGLFCGLINGDRNCEWGDVGADARGADLTNAALNVFSTEGWRFDDAVLDHTAVQFNQIESFRSAVLRGPVLLESSSGAGGGGGAVRLSAPEWRHLLTFLWTGRPSFDCARAATSVERGICDPDSALDRLDRRLAELFRAQLAEGMTTRAEQRRWLRTRNACGSRTEGWERSGCIYRAYEDRLDELMRRGAVARWIRPGARRLFLSSDVAPPAAFQQTALYRRIFPVLLGTAQSRIIVHVRDRERIEASGDAYGSNGHSCTLDSRSYRFHPPSGWFGAPRSATYRNVVPRLAAFEDVLRFAGNDAVVGPPDGRGNNGEYVGCGARAGFESVTQVRVPPEQRAAVTQLLDADI